MHRSTRKIVVFVATIVLISCVALVSTTCASASYYQEFNYCSSAGQTVGCNASYGDPLGGYGYWATPGFAHRIFSHIIQRGNFTNKMYHEMQFNSDTGYFRTLQTTSSDDYWWVTGYYKTFCVNTGSSTVYNLACLTNRLVS
jgi:hypothetical protein